MLSITAVMILPPYLASTAYLWQICAKDKYPKTAMVSKCFAMVCGVAGTVYALWMIYAAGLNYLAMAFWFMALGIIVYCKARSEQRKLQDKTASAEPFFTMREMIAAIIIVVIALAALVWQTDHDPAAEKLIHKWTQKIEM